MESEKEESEGIRRIVIVASWLATIGWLIFALSKFSFRPADYPKVWVITIVGAIFAYSVPVIFAKIILWIKDGFQND
jgi:hypothetical protein